MVIKITGQGTQEDIIKSLQLVISGLTDIISENDLPIAWEDGTLLTELEH